MLIVYICVILASSGLAQSTPPPTPIPIPVYERGAIPNWFLPQAARQNGLTFLGAHERLRVAVDKVREAGMQFAAPMHGAGSDRHACMAPMHPA